MMASIKKRPNGTWRARYRDDAGKEHARHFKFKDNPRDPSNSAQHWLDGETTKLRTGTWVDPKTAKTTVSEWCQTWLAGYNQRRRTVLQARGHIKHIEAEFGDRRIGSIRPSEIRTWVGKMKSAGLKDSTVHAVHGRLSQILAAAVLDGLIPRSPAGRHTSPRAGSHRAYVATTEQVWALHDAMPDGLKPAILLGAFAGLRVAEVAALRVEDVDFMRGVITPAVQYPGEPLKTEISKTPIPIALELALELNLMPAKWGSTTLVVSEFGRGVSPGYIQSAFRDAREVVTDLPAGFRFHDLRHYYASLLIASGLDVKTVQARVRHGSAKTTLDTYGHMWPDRDESSRAAVADVFRTRADSLRTPDARLQ